MHLFLLRFLVIYNVLSTPPTTTWPRPEVLVIKTDTFYIQGEFQDNFPLGALFHDGRYRAELEALTDTTCWSSNCPRSIVGTWKIFKEDLYLTELAYCCHDRPIPLAQIFNPVKVGNIGVRANWVSQEFPVTTVPAPYHRWIFGEDVQVFKARFEKGHLRSFATEE